MSKKREDILTVSLSLFKKHGFNNVGVDQLINESKVAKMTFYKYFPSKLKLVKACLVHEHESIKMELTNFQKSKKSCNNIKEELRNLLLFFFNYSRKPFYNGCLFNAAYYEINESSVFARKNKAGEAKKHIQPIVDSYNLWLSSTILNILETYSINEKDSINIVILSLIDEILSSNSKIKDFSRVNSVLDVLPF